MAAWKYRWISIPVVLLAIGDLVLLGQRLQPWQEIANLPGQGTTGYDPVISLLAYIVLLFWIGSSRNAMVQKSLVGGLLLSVPCALLTIGAVLVPDFHLEHERSIEIGMLTIASILWGIAGMHGSKLTKSPNVGIVAGAWSAMISALLTAGMILARMNLGNATPLSSDPWKQYQGLAIGSQTVQSLVYSLNTVTGFLLIAPLVGGALGLVFAMIAQD